MTDQLTTTHERPLGAEPQGAGSGVDTPYWHPFANMAKVRGQEMVIVSGQGCEVTDRDGRTYLDATAALWFCNVGYGRTQIVDAVARQLSKLPAYSTFGPYVTDTTLEAAGRIAGWAPFPEAAVFLTSGGSDAVETAGKLVRSYWSALGQPHKRVIVGRPRAYHGMHAYGTSLAGIAANREDFGDMVPDVAHVAEDSVAAVEREIERVGAENVGAFIGEPVIGAGGVVPPPDGYWAGVADLCRRHDILLISDEVVCGFGRVGHRFGCERYGFTPDMITFAKGVTSGYLPLGGVIASSRLKAPFWEGEGRWFRHGYTYSGHAGASAAALANLDIVESEGLADRVRSIEPTFTRAAESLLDHPLIGEVRVAGLLSGVEFDPALVAGKSELPNQVVMACRERGLLTRALGASAIQVSPALVIEPHEIERLFGMLRGAFDSVHRSN
ncbi:MAG TPA: aminotransferase class III-fold pyridoxal phosphate-dependent enzyme [Solirubrobacteraceae bacterium]